MLTVRHCYTLTKIRAENRVSQSRAISADTRSRFICPSTSIRNCLAQADRDKLPKCLSGA